MQRSIEMRALPTRPELRPGTWRIDPAASSVGFTATQFGLKKVHGRFTSFSGTISMQNDPLQSSVQAVISAQSVASGIAQRDRDLRKRGLLKVDEFPELRFISFGLERTGDSSVRMRGALTIRGITREVDLDVRLDDVGSTGEGYRARFVASGQIDIRQFNVARRRGPIVGRRVSVHLDIDAVFEGAAA